jgi:phosphoribosylformylglycinamidine synthase
LVDDAPEYDRPHSTPEIPEEVPAHTLIQDISISAALKNLIGSEDLCSRRWIYEQYDSHVMADTIIGPGGDCALTRVYGTNKALALTTDCTPRYVEADPYNGGKQAVVEAYRNIIAAGATPLAVTNNLNFGNPEKPEIMAQLVHSVTGMKDACAFLSTPVVSGNVSLYNETDGNAIKPCPVIGMVGLIDDWQNAGTIALPPDAALFIIGQDATTNTGWLSNSIYAKSLAQHVGGAPPPIDLEAELRTGSFILSCYENKLVQAAHDISDGGMLVALAEMMLAGNQGASITLPDTLDTHSWCFAENQSSYIIATNNPDQLIRNAEHAHIPLLHLGKSNSNQELKISNGDLISLEEIRNSYETGLRSRLEK